jgi:hypothetical protein
MLANSLRLNKYKEYFPCCLAGRKPANLETPFACTAKHEDGFNQLLDMQET